MTENSESENKIPESSSPAPDTDTQSKNEVSEAEDKPKKYDRRHPSGAYWYTETDEETLKKNSFIRTILSVIAFLLQVVVLLLPQGGLEYVTNNLASYAYVYMWMVFVMIAVSLYVMIMNATRYKLAKRIPVECAPRSGFSRRTYFGCELYMGVNAVMFGIELSFVCIHYDGVGLLAMFICLAALGASIWSRMVAYLTLRDAELIPAPDSDITDNKTEKTDDTTAS